jgi:hypothetical protein
VGLSQPKSEASWCLSARSFYLFFVFSRPQSTGFSASVFKHHQRRVEQNQLLWDTVCMGVIDVGRVTSVSTCQASHSPATGCSTETGATLGQSHGRADNGAGWCRVPTLMICFGTSVCALKRGAICCSGERANSDRDGLVTAPCLPENIKTH